MGMLPDSLPVRRAVLHSFRTCVRYVKMCEWMRSRSRRLELSRVSGRTRVVVAADFEALPRLAVPGNPSDEHTSSGAFHDASMMGTLGKAYSAGVETVILKLK